MGERNARGVAPGLTYIYIYIHILTVFPGQDLLGPGSGTEFVVED